MNKDQKLYEMVRLQVERLGSYPEIMALLHDFLKEVEKQVGEFEGEVLSTEMGDALFDVMDEHGWIDEGEEDAKKEIQELVNKSIKKS